MKSIILLNIFIFLSIVSFGQIRDTTITIKNKEFKLEYDTQWDKKQIKEHIEYYKNVFAKPTQKMASKIKDSLLSLIPLSTDGCTNGGFENNYNGWTGLSLIHSSLAIPIENGLSSNPGILPFSAIVSTANGGNYINIEGAGNDPVLSALSTPVALPKVRTGIHSIRLGNDERGRGSEGIAKRFIVTASNAKYYFQYAVIMDNSHSLPNGSVWGNEVFFVAEAVDMSGNTIDKIVEIGNPNNPFIIGTISSWGSNTFPPPSQPQNNLYYRNWRCAYLDLSAHIGQEVVVTFINADCSIGAHKGYTYIDAVCELCSNVNEGDVSINLSSDTCINFPQTISGTFALPATGNPTNSAIKLNIYQNNVLISTINNPTISGNNYTFSLSATDFPNQNNGQCYDIVSTLSFQLHDMNGSPQTVTQLSSTVVQGVQDGEKPGLNNDICFCSKDSNPSTTTLNDSCSFLCDSNFELPVVPAGAGNFIPKCQVPCWNTTNTENSNDSNCMQGVIEFWRGAVGPGPHSGNQFVELNASSIAKLYQDFTVSSPGRTVTISFWHAGRAGTDPTPSPGHAYPNTMQVSIANGISGTPLLTSPIYTGAINVWTQHSLTYTFPTAGNYTIIFSSLDPLDANDAGGNFLDDITIHCSTDSIPDPDTCCGIPDFNVSLNDSNGNISLTVNGGSNPVQELEVSMMDYHVSYSLPDCKPNDMGIFGNLSSSTTNLVNLVLNAADNNSNSLSWLPGSPSIINNKTIQLDISKPLKLNLPCCDVVLNYCLKVRIKDINCNVCERIVCVHDTTKHIDTPCLDIIRIDSLKCKGANNQGGNDYSFSLVINNPGAPVLHTALSWTCGTMSFFPVWVPSGTSTCSGTLSTTSTTTTQCCVNYNNQKCKDSLCFVLPPCSNDSCRCGSWMPDSITASISTLNNGVQTKKLICGGTYNSTNTLSNVQFVFPSYMCNPNVRQCLASYNWKITCPPNNNICNSGNGNTINNINFASAGSYIVSMYASCNGKICDSCKINININNDTSCLDIIKVDSLKCMGSNTAGGYNYSFSVTINNPGAAISCTYISASCGVIAGLPNPIPTGTNTYTGSFSTFDPTITNCCIRYLNRKCKDSICFDLPPCSGNTCGCGSWKSKSILLVKPNPGKINDSMFLKCGDIINDVEGFTNINIAFPIYNCNPNSTICNVSYNWKITGPVPQSGNTTVNVINNVNLSAPGPYTISMYASCNGKICDSCNFTLNFKDKPKCKCDKWQASKVSYSGAGTFEKIKCGQLAPGELLPGTSYTFTSSIYICNPADASCQTTYYWRVDGVLQGTTTTQSFPIIFTSGPHTITITPFCGSDSCTPCEIRVKVKASDCKCGHWDGDKRQIVIHGFNAGATDEIEYNLKCDETYNSIIVGTSLDLLVSYICTGINCAATYSWTISPPTGSSSQYNANLIPNYIFDQLGLYTIKLKITCNGTVCDSCEYYIKVTKSKKCDCGKWSEGDVSYIINGETHTVACDNVAQTDFVAGTLYTFTSPIYNCSPSSPSCSPTYICMVDGIQQGVATNTPNFKLKFKKGNHVVSIIPRCGDIECPSCQFKIIVK